MFCNHIILSQGIYRLSGQKSKVTKLLGDYLERQTAVDLQGEDCHTITGAVKAILYDLPDPIFTYDLYPQFVSVAGKSEAIIKLFFSLYFSLSLLSVFITAPLIILYIE